MALSRYTRTVEIGNPKLRTFQQEVGNPEPLSYSGPFKPAPPADAQDFRRFDAMAAPKRKDLLGKYRTRLSAAKKFRESEGYDALWGKLIDLYKGKHFPEGLGGEDRIAVNVSFSTINVIAPSVAVNYPKVVVWARKPEDDPKAVMLEAITNYWWKHYEVRPEFKRAVKDYLIIGHGWLKTGYRYVEEERKLNQAAYQDSLDAAKGQASDYAAQSPDLSSVIPSEDEIASSLPDTELVVVEDRPFVERVSPFDVYVDPEATSIEDACWIAQRVVKTLDEVRNDPRYKAKAKSGVKPDGQLNPSYRSDKAKPSDDLKRVTIWEWYDLHTGTMCVFSELGDDFLVDPRPQPYHFGHPFVMLRNYEVPDCFYPMGELEAIEPLQQELDKTRSQMMNHRKRYARKYLYRPEAFDATGAAALASDKDNAMVPVTGSTPLNEAVFPLPQTQLPPEFYQQSDIIENDIDRVTGVTEYQRGEIPEIRRTATEANIIQDAANSRAADKLATIEEVISQVARRLVALAQQYLTEDKVARVIGSQGHPMWVPYNREDIQGEFDFEVEGGSTQPENDTFRRQQAQQMLTAFSPYIEAGFVDPKQLIAYALQYGFGVKNVEKFLGPGPQQQAQGPTPQERLVESINYKDAPADIQRQMEQQAGFQPSQAGGSSPMEAQLAGAQAQLAAAQQQAQAQMARAGVDHAHAAQMAQGQQAHDMAQTGADHGQEAAMAQLQALAAAQQAQQGQSPTPDGSQPPQGGTTSP